MAVNPPGPKSNRQKVIAVIVIIVMLIIGWQIMALFSGGTPPTAEITPAAKPQMSSAPPANAPAGETPAPPAGQPTEGALPAEAGAPAPPPPSGQLQQATVDLTPQLVEVQKESEQKYIDQLNQLQNLKIEREIAETNQAIAVAKLATVTAEKNVSDLLTKPETPPPGTIVGPILPAVITPPPPPPPPTTEVKVELPPPPPEIIYNVTSVALQLGRWSAILSHEGKLYNVTVGDILPPDGSKVIEINNRFVVLQLKGKRKTIGMVTSIEDSGSVIVVNPATGTAKKVTRTAEP